MMRATHIAKARGVARTKAAKSGLIFPVARILRYMKKRNAFRTKRIETKASIYLSAVIEYVTRELAELAGIQAKRDKRKLITPRHIMLSVMYDEEFLKCLKTVMFPFSGVVPRIYSALLQSNQQSPRPSTHRPASTPRRRNRSVVRSNNVQNPTTTLATLSERFLTQNTKLIVLRGNVVSTPGSVVVHPTSSGLNFGGQVGGALLRAAGPTLHDIVSKEVQENGRMESGGVRLTEAAGLPFDYILHCSSPSYQPGNPEDSKKQLSDLIEKCLRLCDDRGLPHLVLPSVGSGNSHYPKQLAAETILRAIKTYCDLHSTTTKLETIKFVLYDQESVSVYCAELARLQ